MKLIPQEVVYYKNGMLNYKEMNQIKNKFMYQRGFLAFLEKSWPIKIWKKICSDFWGDFHTQLICRNFNYSGGFSLHKIWRLKSWKPIYGWLVNRGLDEFHPTIKMNPYFHTECSNKNNVEILCFNKTSEVNLTLRQKVIRNLTFIESSPSFGFIPLISFERDETQGSYALCNDSLTKEDIKFFCLNLGFEEGQVMPTFIQDNPNIINLYSVKVRDIMSKTPKFENNCDVLTLDCYTKITHIISDSSGFFEMAINEYKAFHFVIYFRIKPKFNRVLFLDATLIRESFTSRKKHNIPFRIYSNMRCSNQVKMTPKSKCLHQGKTIDKNFNHSEFIEINIESCHSFILEFQSNICPSLPSGHWWQNFINFEDKRVIAVRWNYSIEHSEVFGDFFNKIEGILFVSLIIFSFMAIVLLKIFYDSKKLSFFSIYKA